MKALGSPGVRRTLAAVSLFTYIIVVLQSNSVSPQQKIGLRQHEVELDLELNYYFLIMELVLNIILFIEPLLKLITFSKSTLIFY